MERGERETGRDFGDGVCPGRPVLGMLGGQNWRQQFPGRKPDIRQQRRKQSVAGKRVAHPPSTENAEMMPEAERTPVEQRSRLQVPRGGSPGAGAQTMVVWWVGRWKPRERVERCIAAQPMDDGRWTLAAGGLGCTKHLSRHESASWAVRLIGPAARSLRAIGRMWQATSEWRRGAR